MRTWFWYKVLCCTILKASFLIHRNAVENFCRKIILSFYLNEASTNTIISKLTFVLSSGSTHHIILQRSGQWRRGKEVGNPRRALGRGQKWKEWHWAHGYQAMASMNPLTCGVPFSAEWKTPTISSLPFWYFSSLCLWTCGECQPWDSTAIKALFRTQTKWSHLFTRFSLLP